MKSKLFAVLFMSIAMVACQKDNQKVTPDVNNAYSAANSNTTSTSRFSSGQGAEFNGGQPFGTNWTPTAERTEGSKFIPVLEANAMIASYLCSIHFEHNDQDIRSFSVDADMLRAYLADKDVKNVKLIFGHTLDYINTGNKGRLAGYQCGALTIIIAGYNADGKYVFHDGKVLDHAAPCPYSCAPGNAGNSFLY